MNPSDIMSSKGETPRLQPDSELPEITNNPCNLSSSTPSILQHGNTLTSLLLQIQEYHSSELHKLLDQVGRWKVKCNKLAKISNDNASIAKKYCKQNKLLQAQVTELKCQIRALQSPRQGGLTDSSKIHASPPDQASPKETAQAHTNHVEDLTKKTSKISKKLTSKKTNKKVRYSEITTNEVPHMQAVRTLALIRFPEQIMPSDVSSVSNETAQMDASRLPAPDTCVPPTAQTFSRNAGSGAMSVIHTHSIHTPGGHSQRISSLRMHAVPETLRVDDDELTFLELNDGSLMDAPISASTPVRCHSQMSLSSDSMQIQNPKTFQIPESTQQILKLAPSESGQALLTSPMPKSESQYPVDLSSTQIRSPTFCGEGLSLTTPGSANNQSRQHGTTNVERTVPTPNAGEGSDLHVYATDESYESDASILLLGPKVVHPHPSPQSLQHQIGMPQKVLISAVSKQDQAFRRKEKTHTSKTSTIVSRNINPQRYVKDTNILLQSQAKLSMAASKKRKMDLEDSTNYDEIVLPISFDKENSPEGLDDPTSLKSSRQHPNPRQAKKEKVYVHGHVPEQSGALSKGSRNLKQSKLTANLFKPGRNKSASLMHEYNGGSLMNVDSQSDAYMNRAIELSLIGQEAEARGKNMLGSEFMPVGLEDGVGFKVPTVPQRKRQCCIPETSPMETNALQNSTEQSLAELPESLPESVQFTSSPQDLNGSIDPVIDLTTIENETCPSNIQSNQSIAGGSHDVKHLERGLKGPNWESGPGRSKVDRIQQQTGDDSCLDLFEDEEESSAEEIDQPAGRDRTGFIENFDEVPKMNVKPNYKYTEVVRKHEERQKLKGFGCKECDKFYGGLPLTAAEREERMKTCSRHRAQFSPPNTPDHYWSVGFPDTQTCQERGYIKESTGPDERTRKRKNNYYRNLFSGKEVDDAREEEGDGD